METHQLADWRSTLRNLIQQAIQTFNEEESSDSELGGGEGSYDGIGDDGKEDIPGDESTEVESGRKEEKDSKSSLSR